MLSVRLANQDFCKYLGLKFCSLKKAIYSGTLTSHDPALAIRLAVLVKSISHLRRTCCSPIQDHLTAICTDQQVATEAIRNITYASKWYHLDQPRVYRPPWDRYLYQNGRCTQSRHHQNRYCSSTNSEHRRCCSRHPQPSSGSLSRLQYHRYRHSRL